MEYITIQPSGTLDNSEANKIHTTVNDAMNRGVDKILLDFQDISFMNSFAIRTLVASLQSVKDEGKSLFICSLNPQMKIFFEITRLDHIFDIYEDRLMFEDSIFNGRFKGYSGEHISLVDVEIVKKIVGALKHA